MKLNENDIPDGWKITELGNIFTFQKKSKHKAGEGKKSGKYKFFTSSVTQDKFFDDYDFDGEFLIFGSGGKPSVHYCNGKFSTSADCFVVEVNKCILGKFVYYYLYTNIYLLEAGFKGAGLKHISKKYIAKIKIQYPVDKQVQKIIIEKLTNIQESKFLREKSGILTENFIKSVFFEMFGNPQSDNKWPLVKLEKLAEIKSGVTKGRKLKNREIIKLPYLRVANVQDGYLDLSEIKFIKATSSDLKNYGLKTGDILLTEGGDFDKLGRGAIWDDQIKNCIHQNHIFRVRLDEKKCIPEYLNQYLQTQYAKKYFLKASKKTSNLATINMTQLKAFPVRVPPIEIQRRFLNFIIKINPVKNTQEISKKNIEDLFNSLSQKAFRGELTC